MQLQEAISLFRENSFRTINASARNKVKIDLKVTNNKSNKMKNVRKNKMRLSMKQVSRAYASLIVILSISLSVFFNFNHVQNTFGVSANHYHSNASANWNSPSTFHKFSGGTATTIVAPTNTNNIIIIQNQHAVNLTADNTRNKVAGNFMVRWY